MCDLLLSRGGWYLHWPLLYSALGDWTAGSDVVNFERGIVSMYRPRREEQSDSLYCTLSLLQPPPQSRIHTGGMLTPSHANKYTF